MNVRWVGAEKPVYELVGGRAWFYELLDHFYEDVELQNQIRHLYPDDLTSSKKNTADFLIQYWGGPSEYSENRGHPRLRMRHSTFSIGKAQKDSWLAIMEYALNEMDLNREIHEAMHDYFLMAANHMINTDQD